MGIAEGFRLYCAPQSVLKVPVTKVEDEYIVSPGYVFWMPRIRVVSGCRARVYGTWLPHSGRCGARSAGRWRVSVFGVWGGMQLARCCRVCSCCLGGIATIGVRHAGDTPSRGFYGSKTPRCAAGLCGGLSVLCSTCSPPRPDAPKQGCLGRSGRRCERRFAMLGACRRASSAWSAWLASSVRGVAGPGVNRCRVQKGGTPQGPASNDAISPVGRC